METLGYVVSIGTAVWLGVAVVANVCALFGIG